jgi:hypothetical protein
MNKKSVALHALTTLGPEMNPQYPLNRRLGRSQSWSGRSDGKYLVSAGIWTPDRPAPSLVAILTTLLQFLMHYLHIPFYILLFCFLHLASFACWTPTTHLCIHHIVHILGVPCPFMFSATVSGEFKYFAVWYCVNGWVVLDVLKNQKCLCLQEWTVHEG